MVTASGSQRVTYTLDAADRMITRLGTGTGAGADNSSTVYGYTGTGDTSDVQLGAGNVIAERYLSLPGGVLLTKRYITSGGDVWSIPNLHDDIVATTNGAGVLTGSGFLYDPFGQPLDAASGVSSPAATPATRTNGPTDGWEGQHQRGYENHNGLNATIMGARIYLPTWGQFGAVDPVPGGNPNPYVYPADPINSRDLTGEFGCGWKFWTSCSKPKSYRGSSAAICGNTGCITYQVSPKNTLQIGIRAYNDKGVFEDIEILKNGKRYRYVPYYIKGHYHTTVPASNWKAGDIFTVKATYTTSCSYFFVCTTHALPHLYSPSRY